jgi:hypothetical protein
MNAQHDNNNVTTELGVSNADGVTPLKLRANPSTHILDVEGGSTGSDLGNDDAKRDDNYTTCLLAVSSVDGVTPVPLYINAITNKLLIKST